MEYPHEFRENCLHILQYFDGGVFTCQHIHNIRLDIKEEDFYLSFYIIKAEHKKSMS